MLSRLPVRTKLLAILLPSLLALAVLAGLGIRERVVQSDAAGRTVVIARSARAANLLVNELQRERLIAVGSKLGEPAVTQSQLEEQVTQSDRAGANLREQLDDLKALGDESSRSYGPASAADRYRARLSDLGGIRAMNLEADVALRTLADRYSALIESLLDTTSELYLGAKDISGSTTATHWLSEAKEADARSAALGTIILSASPAGTEWIAAEIGRLQTRADNLTAVFLNDTDQTGRAAFEAARQSPGYVASIIPFAQLGSLDAGQSLNSRLVAPLSMKDFVTTATGRFDAVTGAEKAIVGGQVAAAESIRDEAGRGLRLYVGLSVAAILAAFVLALTVARDITRSLRRLTGAARTVTTEQLPALVESMRSPEAAARLAVTEVELNSRDELGELAETFNRLQRAAVEVAASQAQALRTGISDIFVSLARRNQTLLDRQIEFIDRLESNEEDPDQLEHLFRLDHLATRMRRNAESLLVLAGAEPPRRRAREVPLTDVIRVAVGEVEDFSRINLLAVDEATVIGGAAVDIAHLLSELMENGAQYSPPDRMVEVVGHRVTDGSYVISVADHGVGMSADQLMDANQLLANPPAIGLSLSRSLGFVVTSTLASRHGISIKLVHGPTGGVTAHVMLPASVVVSTGGAEPVAAGAAGSAITGRVGAGFETLAKAELGRSTGGTPADTEARRRETAGGMFGDRPTGTAQPLFRAPAGDTSAPRPVGGWTVSGEYVEDLAAHEAGVASSIGSGGTAAEIAGDAAGTEAGAPLPTRRRKVRDSVPISPEATVPTSTEATMPTSLQDVAPEPVAETASLEPVAETVSPEPVAESVSPEPVAETVSPEPVAETVSPSIFGGSPFAVSDATVEPSWPEAPVVSSASLTPPPPPGLNVRAETPSNGAPGEEPSDDLAIEDRPARLSDAVPMGVAFERGLFSLLERRPTAGEPDDGLDVEPDSIDELPQRERGVHDFTASPPDGRAAAPARPPHEVRNLLSRYREGLSSGRGRDASFEDPDPTTPSDPGA